MAGAVSYVVMLGGFVGLGPSAIFWPARGQADLVLGAYPPLLFGRHGGFLDCASFNSGCLATDLA
jgi:hypothetical protein